MLSEKRHETLFQLSDAVQYSSNVDLRSEVFEQPLRSDSGQLLFKLCSQGILRPPFPGFFRSASSKRNLACRNSLHSLGGSDQMDDVYL